MRIDKALWFLRLAPSRTLAQQLIERGHVRLNGRRIAKPSVAVKPGDVLTLPLVPQVKVIALEQLPSRRGPADEAQSCYRVLDERAANPIAGTVEEDHSFGDPLP